MTNNARLTLTDPYTKAHVEKMATSRPWQFAHPQNVIEAGRHERRGRLNQDWGRLSPEQRQRSSRSEQHLEAASRGAAAPCHLDELA